MRRRHQPASNAFRLDRGRESVFALPLPPNRTGGSPASGSPVSGCSFEKEHAFRAVPKGAGQTFGSTRANGTRLVPPPVSPRGHSRWFGCRTKSFKLRFPPFFIAYVYVIHIYYAP